MITKQQIKSLSNSRFYERGRQIYNSGWMVERFSVEKDGELDYIEALVTGSRNNTYNVNVTYNTAAEQVEDIDCDCPAYAEYSGICKHCVAVLLEYEDYCDRQIRISAYAKASGKKMSAMLTPERYTAGNKTKPAVRETDKEVKKILEQAKRMQIAHIQEQEIGGKVELEPHLTLIASEMRLAIKIGIRHKYVVKDLWELADNIANCRNYSYGKNLTFVHAKTAFSEASQSLVQYIMEWARENRKYYMRPVYYSSFGSGAYREVCKEIVMDSFELERFLEAFQGDTIEVKKNAKEETWQIIRRSGQVKFRVSGQDGGAELKLENGTVFVGNKYRIYLQNKKICLVPRKPDTMYDNFLEILENRMDRTLFVQKEDLPFFCKEILSEVKNQMDLVKRNFKEENYILPDVSFEIYLDMPQKQYITCRILAVYGEKKYNVAQEQEDSAKRDWIREEEVRKQAELWFNAFDSKENLFVLAEDEEKLVQFFIERLQKFHSLGEVFISDQLKKVKLRTVHSVTAGVSLSGNLLELKMSVDDLSPEEVAAVISAYHKKKRYYRLKDGDILDLADEKLQDLYELTSRLGLQEKELKREQIELPGCRALYVDEQLHAGKHVKIWENEEMKERILSMGEEREARWKVPEALERQLRDYQKAGVRWISRLKECGFGGILADDMGLGKTLQVIAFLAAQFADKEEKFCRTLIVAPASLVYNWQSELERFAPEIPVRVLTGTAEQREEMIRQSGKREVLLTSYDLLKRDIRFYDGVEFSNEIIDEAQYIKNHTTQASKAVRRVKAEFHLALTGTPVENRLSELWSIFQYLMPGFFGNYPAFRKEFELPVLRQEEEAAQRLQKLIRPFLLRRRKKDVLKELPDKIEKDTYIKLETEQQQLYDAHVKRLRLFLEKQNEEEFKTSKIAVLAELTKLRQLCCCPGLLYEDYLPISAKERLCLELVQHAVESGHKVLIFSQFTTMLEQLCKRLEQMKVKYYLLTGSTSKEKRKEMVQAFQEDEIPVFCISLKAGGTGLNLTAADIVIHYDPWWNLAVQEQATDRTHRIGQENVVSVYRLIAKDTIEENIIRLQNKKRELADSILKGEGMSRASFSREELLELIGGGE